MFRYARSLLAVIAKSRANTGAYIEFCLTSFASAAATATIAQHALAVHGVGKGRASGQAVRRVLDRCCSEDSRGAVQRTHANEPARPRRGFYTASVDRRVPHPLHWHAQLGRSLPPRRAPRCCDRAVPRQAMGTAPSVTLAPRSPLAASPAKRAAGQASGRCQRWTADPAPRAQQSLRPSSQWQK